MERELISVIIPFYNAEVYIPRCVKSLQSQTHTNFEAIFIDDGSTDGAVDILRDYQDDRFLILQQGKKGVSAARNLGLQSARGEYIAFMDVDDALDSKYLEVLLFDAHQQHADLVLCNYWEEYGSNTRKEIKLPWVNKILTKEEIQDYLLPLMIAGDPGRDNGIRGLVWRTFVKKSFWEQTGVLFDERVSIAEDFLFLLQLYHRADSIYIEESSLYTYYKNLNSTLNRFRLNSLEQNLMYHDILTQLLKQENLNEKCRERYRLNKLFMYTAELSNSSRNPNLFKSIETLKELHAELKKELFDWREYPLSMGRVVSLWLLEKEIYVPLLVLYRVKEKLRLRVFAR